MARFRLSEAASAEFYERNEGTKGLICGEIGPGGSELFERGRTGLRRFDLGGLARMSRSNAD